MKSEILRTLISYIPLRPDKRLNGSKETAVEHREFGRRDPTLAPEGQGFWGVQHQSLGPGRDPEVVDEAEHQAVLRSTASVGVKWSLRISPVSSRSLRKVP